MRSANLCEDTDQVRQRSDNLRVMCRTGILTDEGRSGAVSDTADSKVVKRDVYARPTDRY